MRRSATLKAGDWVQVKSAPEIVATLDEAAQLDGMPFMPEMLKYCGKVLRVSARAHKTCDTVDYVGGRRLWNTVHLEDLRCDGAAHGGCGALCLLFWREQWLRPVEVLARAPDTDESQVQVEPAIEAVLRRGTRARGEASSSADPTYVCQATRLPDCSEPLRPSDLLQYVEDFTSGNVGALRMLRGFAFLAYETVIGGRYGIGTPLRWIYDRVARLRGGAYPGWRGRIPKGGKTPSRRLDLVEAEWVRVRPFSEILETVDEDLRNRGMGFHSEMVPFTNGKFRVLRRLEKIINEKTGKMIFLKNDCVILEGVTCQARYINNSRRFCPRRMYPYFREIWLERTEAESDASRHPTKGRTA